MWQASGLQLLPNSPVRHEKVLKLLLDSVGISLACHEHSQGLIPGVKMWQASGHSSAVCSFHRVLLLVTRRPHSPWEKESIIWVRFLCNQSLQNPFIKHTLKCYQNYCYFTLSYSPPPTVNTFSKSAEIHICLYNWGDWARKAWPLKYETLNTLAPPSEAAES